MGFGVAGAALGFATGFIGSIASQAINNVKNGEKAFSNIDSEQALRAGGTGAIVGGVGGLTFGLGLYVVSMFETQSAFSNRDFSFPVIAYYTPATRC